MGQSQGEGADRGAQSRHLVAAYNVQLNGGHVGRLEDQLGSHLICDHEASAAQVERVYQKGGA